MSSPFKMAPKTPFMKALVGKQGNLPQHLKQAILDAPAKKVGGDKGKKKKDDFRYESDMPGVTGTTYTKDTKETASDYTRGGKASKVGQKTSDPSFEPGQKPTVTSTYRDRTGKKKSGRTGQIEVEIKKGSTRFTTDKKKSTGKSPAKSYGKSPMKKDSKKPMTAEEIKKNKETLDYRRGKGRIKESGGDINARGVNKGRGVSGAAKVAGSAGTRGVKKDYTASGRSMGTSGRVVKEKTASTIKPRGVKKANIKASAGKSPAKMKGVKALKKKK